MRTEDLIAGLSRDARVSGPRADRAMTAALGLGVVVAVATLVSALPPRADVGEAFTTLQFPLKLIIVTTLAVGSIALLRAASRVDGALPKSVLVMPVALMVFALGHELATVPASLFGARLVGRNASVCLVAIPAMAALPLAGLLLALKRATPASPTGAGALAGLAAGAVAACFYGVHCTDDSPLFVATWYGLALAGLSALGALVGRRWLAW
jgi:hypothetical protein